MLRTKLPIPAFLALAALLAGSCSSVPPGGPPTISNLAYGPLCAHGRQDAVCGKPSAGQPADVEISGDGSCVYDKKVVTCTWYGYAFDYALDRDAIDLDCDWSSDHKNTLGNPNGIVQKDTTTMHYKLHLAGRSGHYVQQQYAGFPSNDDDVELLTQSCSYRGEKLFEVDLRLHHHRSALS
jgi:hypothetical protein